MAVSEEPSVTRPTTRSSITLQDPTNQRTLSDNLQEEIVRDESRFEKYGGDDPLDPPDERRKNEKAGPSRAPTTLNEVQVPPDDSSLKVDWDGPDDSDNPQNWSTGYKWFLTGICSFLTLNVTYSSSAPTVATRDVAQSFGKSEELGYLITTCFLAGYVLGPVFWGSGSELLGRRPIFVWSLTIYTLLHLGQSLAQNMTTILVTRFLAGVFGAAPLSNSSGVIADVFGVASRGPAVSLFVACIFLGPVLGPITSAFIVQSNLGWRWVFWVMMIFSGFVASLAIFLLPETYGPVLLHKKAKRLRREDPVANAGIYAEHEKSDWSIKGVIHRTLYRPFHMLAKEPILVLVTIYLSLVYGLLYALFEAFPIVFIDKRGFTVVENGLVFIGVGLGTTTGAAFNAYSIRHYPSLIKKWRGFPPPEERLKPAKVAAPALVVGCFWLGWTGQYPSVPWYVPALSGIVLGFSISLIFMTFIGYLVDTYLMYSASALSATVICRSATAAGFPLFTTQMFTKLGTNWACTLLGCIALLLSGSPFLFSKYGPRIRANSTFSPCIDLRIAEELRESTDKEHPGP